MQGKKLAKDGQEALVIKILMRILTLNGSKIIFKFKESII